MNTPEPKSILQLLENEQMGAVTFVQDYVQLHFDGPCLTAYVWPQVHNQGRSIRWPSPGYRDALCGLIGHIVVRAFEEPGERLAIQFADGAALEISLKDADRTGPEAAMFRNGTSTDWNVW
jgi:hypothetical protein